MINSLQGLRILLCILVFLFHVNSQVDTNIELFSGFGTLAVSYFFILSGFVHYISFKPEATFEENKRKTFNRIKGNYPLHWICLIMMIPLKHSGLSLDFKTVGRILINASLIQSWIPIEKICLDFNSPSWFLCDIIFMILLTVPLCKLVNKVEGKNKLLLCILGIQVLQIFLSFILIDKDKERVLYFNPLIRMFDYFAGIIIGKYWKEHEKSLMAKNILEIFVIILIFIMSYIYRFIPVSFSNAGTIYLIPGCLTVYVISFQLGFISKFLSKNFFVQLSKCSMYFYMIHQVVNINFKGMLLHLRISINPFAYYMVVFVGAITMTFILYKIFKLFMNKNRTEIK